MVVRLDLMEQLGYQASNLEETPWSGDYFAIARGILGNQALIPNLRSFMNGKLALIIFKSTLFQKYMPVERLKK